MGFVERDGVKQIEGYDPIDKLRSYLGRYLFKDGFNKI